MSEALEETIRWALEQPGVTAVVSETEKLNIASQRVLQKAGFGQYRRTEGHLWWRICRE
jgi:ribosomal-protein-alanine N-acetyltransferase